jgi:leucyl-tRNA synthetase
VQHALRKSELDRESEKNKTGVKLEGLQAVHPVSGDLLDIWVADYVLIGYGSGAIMGVPGQDERDFAFAKKYDVPVVFTTSKNEFVNYSEDIKPHMDTYVMANSGTYNGMTYTHARQKLEEDLVVAGKAQIKTHYKIRDWLISRQRYWGAPIPIIHCAEHGAVLVPEDQLPVVLPHIENFAPDGTNHSVLAGASEWVNVPCPTCGKPAQRETDTMDGYVCSTWYLHRYTDPANTQQAFDPTKANYWMPLDFYFGGDHAVAHLLYIRFLQRVFVSEGLISAEHIEPVKKLVYNGYINAADGSKMSKSKGNTVDPMDIITSGYGADALRVFELFIAPYDQDTPWNTNGVPGTYRFLNRAWTVVQEFIEASSSEKGQTEQDVLRIAHKTVKKVTEDLEKLSFNTAVAAMMDMVNQLYLLKAKQPITKSAAWQYACESLVQLLGPFAPHIAEEMWQQLGHTDTVHVGHWPAYDASLLVSATTTLAVQVNGKVRAEISVEAAATKEEVIAAGLANANVQKFLQNKEPTKTIYVPGRILNFVG